VSVRLPLVGVASTAPPSHGARAARMTVARHALTVASRDGSAESFARVLGEALQAQGVPLVVVSERAQALELEGALDVWVGPRPLPGGDPTELAAHASCQLELRSGYETVARMLAAELARSLVQRDVRRPI